MPAAQDRESHCHPNTHKEHDEEECAFKVGWAGHSLSQSYTASLHKE